MRASGPVTAGRVLALQRQIGNRAVSSLVAKRSLQRACADGQIAPGASDTSTATSTIFSVALSAAAGGYDGVSFTITSQDCAVRLGWEMQGDGGGPAGAAAALPDDLRAALRMSWASGEYRLRLARDSHGLLALASWEQTRQAFPAPLGVALPAPAQNVVVVMGSPDPGQGHPLQFVTAGLRESGHTIWFVERTGYELAHVDLDRITSQAPGGRVRWITPEHPLPDQLNQLPVGSVSRLVVYSHGVDGFTTLRYGWGSDHPNYGLNRDDARRVNGNIFTDDGVADLESCQGGTNLTGGSLAQVLADTTGHDVTGWTGRTSYTDVNAGRGGVRGSQYSLGWDAFREAWVRNAVAGDTPRQVTFHSHLARVERER